MLAMCTNGPCERETHLTVTVRRIPHLDAGQCEGSGATQGHWEEEEVEKGETGMKEVVE
jgi:hypothetical protein